MINKSELLSQIRNIRRELDALENIIWGIPDQEPVQTQIVKGNAEADTWLTAKEACEALSISMSHFYRLIHDGKLPKGTEFSARSKRWKLSQIEAFVEKNNTHSESANPVIEFISARKKFKIRRH